MARNRALRSEAGALFLAATAAGQAAAQASHAQTASAAAAGPTLAELLVSDPRMRRNRALRSEAGALLIAATAAGLAGPLAGLAAGRLAMTTHAAAGGNDVQ